MSTTDRRDEALILALGGVTDTTILNRIIRKAQKRLTALGAATPTTNDGTAAPTPTATTGTLTPVDKDSLTPGDEIIIGTPNGEHTRVKVLKVNAARVKIELLEQRGTRSPQPAGTQMSVYPDKIRGYAPAPVADDGVAGDGNTDSGDDTTPTDAAGDIEDAVSA